jgi:hypothetical protein
MTDHNAADDAGSGPPKREPQSGSQREAAWEEVATHLSNLGKQVRDRFNRPASERATETSSGDTVRRFIDTLDDAFTRLGNTVRDPGFRKEAGSSVERLGQALGVTLTEFGQKLEGRFGGARTTGTQEKVADVPPPPTESTPSDATPAEQAPTAEPGPAPEDDSMPPEEPPPT